MPADWSQLQIRPRASPGVRDVTLLKSQLLYQLSYAGAPVIVFAESSSACRRNHGRPPALLSKLLSNLKTVVTPDDVARDQIAGLRSGNASDAGMRREGSSDRGSQARAKMVGVPEIPRAPLSGAARWLYSDRPLVQISLRYGTDDQIWFSIFHEADHVLEHSRRLVFIDTGDDNTDEMEAHANAFARDWLVPSDPYEAFVAAGKFDPDAVRAFAKQMELPPGIVVGLLQHDGHIPPSRLNSLKRPVRWTNQ